MEGMGAGDSDLSTDHQGREYPHCKCGARFVKESRRPHGTKDECDAVQCRWVMPSIHVSLEGHDGLFCHCCGEYKSHTRKGQPLPSQWIKYVHKDKEMPYYIVKKKYRKDVYTLHEWKKFTRGHDHSQIYVPLLQARSQRTSEFYTYHSNVSKRTGETRLVPGLHPAVIKDGSMIHFKLNQNPESAPGPASARTPPVPDSYVPATLRVADDAAIATQAFRKKLKEVRKKRYRRSDSQVKKIQGLAMPWFGGRDLLGRDLGDRPKEQ